MYNRGVKWDVTLFIRFLKVMVYEDYIYKWDVALFIRFLKVMVYEDFIYIYIYIYRGWVQITLSVTLSNITPPVILHHMITCYRIHILEILPLNYMFYMFLTFMPIFMSIGCYHLIHKIIFYVLF